MFLLSLRICVNGKKGNLIIHDNYKLKFRGFLCVLKVGESINLDSRK